jgi:hypothetical protein
MVNRGWVVHYVRGLDEVFKECLFATQLTKLACMLRAEMRLYHVPFFPSPSRFDTS